VYRYRCNPPASSVKITRFRAKTKAIQSIAKICVVSGSGNVAQYTVEKLNHLGAKVVSLSDSNGSIYDAAGITAEKLAYVMDLKNVRRARIKEYADKYGAQYKEGERPWSIKCDCAFPSATQNEVDGGDAKKLLDGGCRLISEGANMPSTPASAGVPATGASERSLE
jgi:glutamate dehydrogenase (NADP+)